MAALSFWEIDDALPFFKLLLDELRTRLCILEQRPRTRKCFQSVLPFISLSSSFSAFLCQAKRGTRSRFLSCSRTLSTKSFASPRFLHTPARLAPALPS
jgi:hypothetical protein